MDPTKTLRTDSYQTFIRGKVTDNKGVLTLLVNGRKAAMKADGTFAAKLKLRIGENRIAVSAETSTATLPRSPSLSFVRITSPKKLWQMSTYRLRQKQKILMALRLSLESRAINTFQMLRMLITMRRFSENISLRRWGLVRQR